MAEIKVGVLVKGILYAALIVFIPLIGIAIVVIFEILPWVFKSKEDEENES